MEHNRAPDPREGGGLSTEDLAQPRAPSGDAPQEDTDAAPRAPAYPGESTAPAGETPAPPDEAAGTPTQDEAAEEATQLLDPQDEKTFRTRWQQIQSEFVDDPREAVHAADALVADVMQQLAATFADHKQSLEGQWNRGEQVNTEDLRTALRRYRSFFNSLLTT